MKRRMPSSKPPMKMEEKPPMGKMPMMSLEEMMKMMQKSGM